MVYVGWGLSDDAAIVKPIDFPQTEALSSVSIFVAMLMLDSVTIELVDPNDTFACLSCGIGVMIYRLAFKQIPSGLTFILPMRYFVRTVF